MADMLTVEELTNLRLGTLATAVSDWQKMSGKLDHLATGSGGEVSAAGLSKKAAAADWKGVNATVGQQFVAKTAKQFGDAAAEAKSVHGLLSDAHAKLSKSQKDLHTAVEELLKQHIKVTGRGTATNLVPPAAESANPGKLRKPTETELKVATGRIRRILSDATETDRIVARALRGLSKNQYDFTEKGPRSVKDADIQQGKEDAAYWRWLISQGNVAKWPQKVLAAFNEMLANQHDNPGFTETFATGLGVKGVLKFWNDLADAEDGHRITGARAKLLGEVQQNLGISLANATHIHSPAMEQWKRDMIAAGTITFPHGNSPNAPYGFQIMGNLMVAGSFDNEFLRDYGAALKNFEQNPRVPGFPNRLGSTPEQIWSAHGGVLDYTNSGADGLLGALGSDPMAGYLRAVSHNPGFASQLFNDGDMADYLIKNRSYFNDDGQGHDGHVLTREYLGKAILAAGTGLNPDEPHVVTSYAHTPEQQAAFTGSVNRLAGLGDRMPPELRDDMAGLLGNYGDQVHKITGNQPDSYKEGDGKMPSYGSLARLSAQISRDPNAHGILMQSMHEAIKNDIYTSDEGRETVLGRAGRSIGFLENVRHQAIDAEKADPTWTAKAMQHAPGAAAVTAAAAAALIPGVGPVASAVVVPVAADLADRGADAAATAYQQHAQKEIDQRLSDDQIENSESSLRYQHALARVWVSSHSDSDLMGAENDIGDGVTVGGDKGETAAGK